MCLDDIAIIVAFLVSDSRAKMHKINSVKEVNISLFSLFFCSSVTFLSLSGQMLNSQVNELEASTRRVYEKALLAEHRLEELRKQNEAKRMEHIVNKRLRIQALFFSVWGACLTLEDLQQAQERYQSTLQYKLKMMEEMQSTTEFSDRFTSPPPPVKHRKQKKVQVQREPVCRDVQTQSGANRRRVCVF